MLKILSIIILVFISYSPAINGDFIWDDDTFLTKNPIMAKPDALKRFWASTEPPDYFPLVSTTLWMQRKLWGPHPMGYHIFNILLHALNAIILWKILEKWKFRGAWMAAVIFALHPVHVESVAWITEIKNLQSTFFFLLTSYSYLVFKDNKNYGWYFFSLLLFLMALLSKTSVVMFPVILLLYHWWDEGSFKKNKLLLSIPFFFLSAIFSLITIWFQYNRAGATGEAWSNTFVERVAIAGKAVWFYFWKLVYPNNLMFIYPRWSIDPGSLGTYVPAVALIGTAVLFWHKRNLWGRHLLAGSGFFVINLFPVLGFFNIYFMRYSFVSDHWQYLASPGIIVMVVWVSTICYEKFKKHRVARATAKWSYRSEPSNKTVQKKQSVASLWYIVVLLKTSIIFLLPGSLALATYHRAGVFKENISLWEDTLGKNSAAWLAHNNIGIELEKQHKYEEAIHHYLETLRINPDYAIAYDNLGLVLMRKGKLQEAAIQFMKSIQKDPGFWESFNNLGYVLFMLGKKDEAIHYFQQSLKINPNSMEAHNNLANILEEKGKSRKAKTHYEKALSINPDNAEIHNNLGTILLREKKFLEAINHFQKAVKIRPDLKEARQNLSIALKYLE